MVLVVDSECLQVAFVLLRHCLERCLSPPGRHGVTVTVQRTPTRKGLSRLTSSGRQTSLPALMDESGGRGWLVVGTAVTVTVTVGKKQDKGTYQLTLSLAWTAGVKVVPILCRNWTVPEGQAPSDPSHVKFHS
jgi:hypothetical protein